MKNHEKIIKIIKFYEFEPRRAATRNLQSATRCDAKSSVGDALRREIFSRRRAATRHDFHDFF